MKSFNLSPIGYFESKAIHPNQAPRQPQDHGDNGLIQLVPGFQLDVAVSDLKGFDRIWLIFLFHKNDTWSPKVKPPRGGASQRSVLSTRSPYRPNPIGISCVTLLSVDSLTVTVGPNDLLDGTPILDIKPYLPYSDSFPNSRIGWLESAQAEKYSLVLSDIYKSQSLFLNSMGVTGLDQFVYNHLEYEPLNKKTKRLLEIDTDIFLAYRTWRIEFQVNTELKQITISSIRSGYSESEINQTNDVYGDKSIHLQFLKHWPRIN